MQYRFHHIFSRPLFAFVMLLLFTLTSSNAFVVAQNNGTQTLPKLRVEQLGIEQGLSQNNRNKEVN